MTWAAAITGAGQTSPSVMVSGAQNSSPAVGRSTAPKCKEKLTLVHAATYAMSTIPYNRLLVRHDIRREEHADHDAAALDGLRRVLCARPRPRGGIPEPSGRRLPLINRKQASARQDERGRLIALRSERLSGYILAVGMFAGIVLAMLQTETFWIAQALLGAWVLAEVSEGVAKLVLYQRGA